MVATLLALSTLCLGWSPLRPPLRTHCGSKLAAGVHIHACANRQEMRAKQRAVRDLGQAMVRLKIPGNAATRYAEALAERGVKSEDELCGLDKAILDACEVRSTHRPLLKASIALPDLTVLAPARPGSPKSKRRGRSSDPETREGGDSRIDGDEHVLTLGEDLDGARIDVALATLLPPLSRSYFSALCSEGRVLIDGAKQTKKSVKVAAGQTVVVTLRAAAELAVLPEAIPLDLVYSDGCMLAVNKPSDMVVHPAPGHWNGTFANALAHLLRSDGHSSTAAARPPDAFGDGLRPGIVHRLDRQTTGVLLGAKTLEAQRGLLDAFASRRVHKTYLAVVVGMPAEETTITELIGRHPTDRIKMAVVSDPGRGRSALSVVHRLASDGRLSLVAVRIGTGRTHQIRVHAAHLQCPVLGDPLYGDASWNKKEARRATRPLLHALQLRLAHPKTGEPLLITAPPPSDLVDVASSLAGCEPDRFDEWLQPRLDSALETSLDEFAY